MKHLNARAVSATLFGIILGIGQAIAQVTSTPIGLTAALAEGDTAIQALHLVNDGDAATTFKISFSSPERERAARGPRRDQPESNYLLVHQSNGWNYDLERIFQGVENLDYDRIQTPADLDNLDLFDYDCLYLGNYQPDAWDGQYNERREMIEDWVDRGGTMYFSAGTNNHNNNRVIFPGGLPYHWNEQNGDQSQNECPLAVGPDDNWFINYMNENDEFNFEWVEGARMHGSGHAHGVIYQREIDEIDNCDWSQVLVMGNPVNEPVSLVYSYGRGYCFVSTSVDGFLHANPQAYHWGRTGAGVLWYLDFLKQPAWIECVPDEGEIAANDQLDLDVVFVSTDLDDGTYELILEVLVGNDELSTAQMSVVLTVGNETSAIRGVVTDAATGDPIEGAVAALDYFLIERPSAENGAYSFADLPAGEYVVLHLPRLSADHSRSPIGSG